MIVRGIGSSGSYRWQVAPACARGRRSTAGAEKRASAAAGGKTPAHRFNMGKKQRNHFYGLGAEINNDVLPPKTVVGHRHQLGDTELGFGLVNAEKARVELFDRRASIGRSHSIANSTTLVPNDRIFKSNHPLDKKSHPRF
jgi:hypothetical protein